MDEEEQLLRTDNLVDRIQKAATFIEGHRQAMSRLATIRGQALVELRRQGVQVKELAGVLGVTVQQIYRLAWDVEGRG